jgi:hypothetical protein
MVKNTNTPNEGTPNTGIPNIGTPNTGTPGTGTGGGGGSVIILSSGALRRIASNVNGLADYINARAASFFGNTKSLEPAWGDGNTGAQIESQYRPTYNQVVELLQGTVQGFRDLANNFTVTASNTDKTENANLT